MSGRKARERLETDRELEQLMRTTMAAKAGVWDVPPSFYVAYQTTGQFSGAPVPGHLRLREIKFPFEIRMSFRTPADFLEAAARAIIKGELLDEVGDVAGACYLDEAWGVSVKKDDPPERQAEVNRLTRQRRLYTHPDREELRIMAGCLIGSNPITLEQYRKTEDQIEECDETEGTIPDAVEMVARAITIRKESR